MREVNSYFAILLMTLIGSGATYLIVSTAFNDELLAAFEAEADTH